jgi:uncharacterized protein YecE (DUF72 family)
MMNKHKREEAQGSLFPQKTLTPPQTEGRASPRRRAGLLAPTEEPWQEPLPELHPRLRLGLCSFTDPDWRGSFYREEETDLLAAYAQRLSTVEIDSTFYGLPKAATLDGWAARTPPNFRFALKFPREVTHERMLEGAEYVTQAFLDLASRLGDRLGPLLLQFPYAFRATRFPHLVTFLEKLPKNFRYVVEVRHRSWLRQPFFQLLEAHKVAFCLIDHPFLPRLEKKTADFYYIRWLGDRRETPGPFLGLRRDPSAPLRWWAKKIRPMLEEVKETGEVYAFANNHYAGHAPATVRRFAEVFQKTR